MSLVAGVHAHVSLAAWPPPSEGRDPPGAGASAICGCTSAGWAPTATAHEIPIIVRGDGCHVWDEHGNQYFDGLSALFCVNIGHGRADVAQAGAEQAKELGFFTNWSYAHPRVDRARRAHRRPRARRPQPRLLHERRQRGRRDRDQARPPVPQAHRQPEQDEVHRARDRLPRHDARRAQRDRHHAAAHAVRAVHARAAATSRTRTSTGSSPATAPRCSPTRSPSGSSSRAPRPSPR